MNALAQQQVKRCTKSFYESSFIQLCCRCKLSDSLLVDSFPRSFKAECCGWHWYQRGSIGDCKVCDTPNGINFEAVDKVD